jgi:protease IV
MGQFFKQTIASIIGTIAGLLILMTVSTTGFVFLFFAATSNHSVESQVKNKSILVLDLSIPIRDSAAPMGIKQVFAGEMDRSLTLRDVLQSLEKASQDDRIVGLFLDGRKGDAISGYAVMAEVRAAIAKFQATGKKIIAYDVGWSEQKYYLASMADEVILNPMGILEFNGLSSQQTFFKGALEKYGVGVQIVRVGDYKSAVEPYTREGFSVENRQQTRELLDDLWDKFLVTVAENRQLETKYLQQIADRQGFIEPEAAKKIGLVSDVAYFDTVSTKLRELTGELEQQKDSFRQIDLSDYIRDRKATDLEAGTTTEVIDQVAVIYAEGAIVGGKGSIEQIGSDRFAKELSELRKDKNIKAIVLRVNSPGGSATASDVILREVLLAKEEKPVIVSMGNVAASGGYWIAAGADYIFAEENTITGSIGVFGLLPNIQKIGNDHGITWDVVQTGKLADISSTVRPKTDTELAIFQQSVKQTYNLFLDKVAQYRKLPKDKVHQIAQGRVWSGKEAVKIGLVDRIGGLDAAIAYAAQQAKLDRNWIVQEYPQNHSWETELVTRLMQTEGIKILQQNDSVTQELQKIKQEFDVFQSFDDPRHIYAHSSLGVDFK